MKKFFFLSLIVLLTGTLILFLYAKREKEFIASSLLRLHVIGESDSSYHQELKLKVRDAVLSEAKVLFANVKNKNEAMAVAEKNKVRLKKAAENCLRREGCTSDVTVKVEKSLFPLKTYGDVRLPGGVYDSLNVKIGDAKGANWWCVMYPALCFSESTAGNLDSDGEKRMKTELGEERFRLITDTSDAGIRIKFKILELF